MIGFSVMGAESLIYFHMSAAWPSSDYDTVDELSKMIDRSDAGSLMVVCRNVNGDVRLIRAGGGPWSSRKPNGVTML